MPVHLDRLEELLEDSKAGKFRLLKGAHQADHEFCAMEAVAWLAGEVHSDAPKCASLVIRAFVTVWNDRATDTERQRLIPYLARLADSRAPRAVEIHRAFLFADYAVRVFAPIALRAIGKPEEAVKLEQLDQITNKKTADAAYAAAAAAEAAAYAAAAYAATHAAAAYAATHAAAAYAATHAAAAADDAATDAAKAAAYAANAADAAIAAAGWRQVGNKIMALLDEVLDLPAQYAEAKDHGF